MFAATEDMVRGWREKIGVQLLRKAFQIADSSDSFILQLVSPHLNAAARTEEGTALPGEALALVVEVVVPHKEELISKA